MTKIEDIEKQLQILNELKIDFELNECKYLSDVIAVIDGKIDGLEKVILWLKK